tara:strand:+ start:352 stop:1203 length:852 start_codon:yes stop_codon:yes gene_type:complete
MFVWLASYPKSGNTLLRSMLAAYFFSEDGVYNFSLNDNIRQFPSTKLFERMGIDITNEKEVIKNYIKAQESINQKEKLQFLKTHSYLFNIDNIPFTNLNNTLGVIYIVRDPRNVVTSYAHHSGISPEHAARSMVELYKYKGDLTSMNSERTTLYMGTWSGNYNSWKSLKDPGRYLLIKYEDLINNKDLTFRKVIKFLCRLKGIKFKIDQVKFRNVIESTEFKKMQKLEQEKGFKEAKTNSETGEKIPFFNLGAKNDWKKVLDPDIKTIIEVNFKKEMKELGYL